jgi:hypothetical protein
VTANRVREAVLPKALECRSIRRSLYQVQRQAGQGSVLGLQLGKRQLHRDWRNSRNWTCRWQHRTGVGGDGSGWPGSLGVHISLLVEVA